MAAQDPTVCRLAAQKAAQNRWKRPSRQTESALADAQLEDYVKRTVARLAEVPLTEDQKSRLSALLRGPSNSGGAAA